MLSFRYFSFLAFVAVLLVVVEGKNQRFTLVKKANQYGAGKFANSAMQSFVHSGAKKLTGPYYFQNVATKAYMGWSTSPQSIFAAKNRKGTMTLSPFGAGTRIKPTASNGKCIAAQFSGVQGVDYAATMYQCATYSTKAVDAGDPQAKQQWHFVPVKGRRDTYFIIPEDHLDDMQTRAISSKSLTTFGGYRSTAIALFNKNDENQMWIVTKA